jgi:hypothetical protein
MDLKDDPEIRRGIERVLAQCRPQLDALLATLRELAADRASIDAERRALNAEKRASMRALIASNKATQECLSEMFRSLNQLRADPSPEPRTVQ